MVVVKLLFVGALVFGIFAVVRVSDRDRDRHRSTPQRPAGALGVLDDRFARGEIDAVEYAERRRIPIEGKDPTRV
jgi:putative membrane protein